jgi:hypothetical protein
MAMEDHDVIVVGGGPSGCAAAIAAARSGARVLLVERYGFLGGMATAGHVGPFMPVTPDGTTRVTRGIFDEVVRGLAARGAALPPEETGRTPPESGYRTDLLPDTTPFDLEELKWMLQELLLEANVRLLCHAVFAEAAVRDGRIQTIVCQNKEGRVALTARMFVDCTGDGDLGACAGIPFTVGRESDGRTQPATLMFRVGGVDTAALQAYFRDHPAERRLASLLAAARAAGDPVGPKDNLLLFLTPRPGEVLVNASRVFLESGTDSASLTAAELEGRRQARQILAFLRRHGPGCGEAYMVSTATQIGIRETRRLQGEYTLCEEDLLGAARFDDAIARACYQIDVHSPTDGSTDLRAVPAGRFYEIPFRVLYSRRLDNLVWAGRCLSATHAALSAVRVMPTCFATGQAAGTAAALAAQAGAPPRRLDIRTLQRHLLEQGVYLGASAETVGRP